ncbi:MAG: CHAP domain-containing protein [Candidatus Colwellbacteria bacterium]
MNQQELFIKWNWRYNDCDGVYSAQCVDIVKQYFQDVLGLPPFRGNAIDYWTNDVPGFVKIKKSLTKSLFIHPKPGDLVVWKTGEFGHVAICNWSRTFDLGVFEQNNPIGSPCHFSNRSYKDVLGWLRPENPPTEAPRPIPKPSKYAIKMVYLSDSNDIAAAADYCDAKLKAFTGGALGLEYVFKPIPPVNAPTGSDLPLEEAYKIVEWQVYDNPFHWVVLGYYGNNSSPGYSTQTSVKKNIWFTNGYKTYSPETLLFELKHFAVRFYNQHRGSNPFIDNYDNYKSADGGLAKVEEQIKQLIPYLSVFKI